MGNRLKEFGTRIFFVFIFAALSLIFYGCGSSDGGLSDWITDSNIIRVSNLKGRLVRSVTSGLSIREQNNQVYFPLVTTQGAKVFLESDSSKYAIADANGDFVIPNVPAGKQRLVANLVQGTTTYRQRSDIINVTGEYETQILVNSIALEPALYNLTLRLSDLTTGSPIWGRVTIWGYTFEAINGVVNLGPFPGGMSKEASITAVGYRDIKTLINFGDTNCSEIFIQMTPTTSTDSNLAPVVEIQQSTLLVRTNEAIGITGIGTDPEGDVISWRWAASAGSFYNPKAQQTTFLAPASSGTVRISLIGTDSKGAYGKAVLDINVEQGGSSGINPQNKPPVAPNTPFPENMAVDMGGELALAWNCSDPNNDSLTYTVNFGKQGSELRTIATALSEPTIIVRDLEANTKYYWQVTAYDEHYASTDSLLWQFTTGDLNNQPPNVPTYPSPVNLADNIDGFVRFSWSGGDPDGDPVTYKIYLATASTWLGLQGTTALTLVHTTNLLKYDYYGLAKGAVYQWQIVATDKKGAMAEGPVWQFATVDPENNMPSYATVVEPADTGVDIPINQKLRWTATDEDNDELFYDVYFGTESNPRLVSASQSQQIYDPGMLEYNTAYYWRIVVSDGKIANPRSDVWSFTTAEVVDETPVVVSITNPASSTEPLRIVFSEYINNSNTSQAFSFNPPVLGNWTWKEDNTVAEFLPSSGSWYQGSYNKFSLAANILEDATGNKVEGEIERTFTIPSRVKVPVGYHSYAFPMVVAANTTVNISIPDLEYGANSYLLAVADADNTAVSLKNIRASLAYNSNSQDPTHALRLAEAEMIKTPIPEFSETRGIRGSVLAAAVGDEREFFINAIATSTAYPRNKIKAKLTKASGNTLIYLDKAISDPDKENRAQAILTTFDTKVLQQVRNAFGNEPELGIDGESRISIVLMNLSASNSTAGYFTSADLYPRSTFRESNEGKIFYIKYGMADTTTFGTLAHEFQHMINYYQKNKISSSVTEEIWLNEALSKYSEEICGYSVQHGDKNTATLIKYSMENNKYQSLTYWQGGDTINYYGQVYLFMHFLAYPGRYMSASSNVTKQLVTGNGLALVGEDNVEAVTGEPFKETVAKWALSLFLNNYSASSPEAYGIHGINLTGTYSGVTLPGYEIENITSVINMSRMKKNSIRCFRKSSTGNGSTTITLTTGSQPITLWLFDERR